LTSAVLNSSNHLVVLPIELLKHIALGVLNVAGAASSRVLLHDPLRTSERESPPLASTIQKLVYVLNDQSFAHQSYADDLHVSTSIWPTQARDDNVHDSFPSTRLGIFKPSKAKRPHPAVTSRHPSGISIPFA